PASLAAEPFTRAPGWARDQLHPDSRAPRERRRQGARDARARRRHVRPLRPRAPTARRSRRGGAGGLRAFLRGLSRRVRGTGHDRKGNDMNDSRIVPVFQILAEDIHALGIRTVFGLMSDDTAVFAVTLDGLGVKFVGSRHENNAIAMAEGHAYAT